MEENESGCGQSSPLCWRYRRRMRGQCMKPHSPRRCHAWAKSAAPTAPGLKAVLVLFLFALAGVAAASQDGRYYLDLSAGFKTGDFGTPVTSNLYYFAPAFGYIAPRYDVSVTLPVLSLTTEAAGQSTTETGIGDVVLRGGAELLPAGRGFSLYGSLAAKLPTADETRGLGTGATDIGAFATLSRELGPVKLRLLTGYIKVGDPSGQNLDDVLLYGLGLSGMRGSTHLYGSVEGRTASVPGADAPLETNVGFLHPLNPRHWVKGSAFIGLSDGGPRFGASLGFVQWF